MNKKFLTSIFTTSILLIGCGSNSSNNISENNKQIQVERGAILNGEVSDAKGQVALAKESNSNIYVFKNEITYPISVTSGIIDVNANGTIDNEDIQLNTVLKSSTNKVSLISTLVYDKDKTIEETNIQKLLNLYKDTQVNATKEQLLKFPSEDKNSAIFTNALYETLKISDFQTNELLEKISSNDNSIISDLKDSISYLKTIYESSNEDLKTKATNIEKIVVDNLVTSSKVEKLTTTKVQEIQNEQKYKSVYFDENILNNKSFYIKSDDNRYLKFSFTRSDVKINTYSKQNNKWSEDITSSTIKYEIRNAKLFFNAVTNEDENYINAAFPMGFFYNEHLISQKPNELNDTSNNSSSNIDISNLLNRDFYGHINNDKTYFCMISIYNELAKNNKRCYVKEDNQWKVDFDNNLSFGSTTNTNTELINEEPNHKRVISIKETNEEYFLMNINTTKNSVSSSFEDKWFLERPLWIIGQ